MAIRSLVYLFSWMLIIIAYPVNAPALLLDIPLVIDVCFLLLVLYSV